MELSELSDKELINLYHRTEDEISSFNNLQMAFKIL